MTPVVSFVLAAAGFVSLARVMDRHQHEFHVKPPAAWQRWIWRSVGACLLVGSALVCVRASGWGTGLVEWAAILTAAATCVVLGLSYRCATLLRTTSQRVAAKMTGLLTASDK